MFTIRAATPADATILTELRRVMHDTINGPHPTDWMPACEEMTRRRLSDDPTFHAYLAEVDGVVAGAATGELRSRFPTPDSPATVAGFLIALSTLPAYRGRGIGGTLTHHLTERFLAAGCERVGLFASRQGAPIYRELGFEDLSDSIVAMNRFAGRPVPVNRWTTPTPSDHSEVPVPS
ncbi:GNAT family N-acetyltransferase [Paractinoplanes lichenicola]|uniref:GNAT family N-acetyltransferase n=1 Tax=Paractinoplanes lichenicola TaxID=2802976 RepID=A0ABS1VGY5_9ACTN|nr:GNAT family N-acetyltransferase [Actinoplanes lichenicola]MBL7253424.1 GNAT family N-acetyltransferase [Actinoplanes lichenicola]